MTCCLRRRDMQVFYSKAGNRKPLEKEVGYRFGCRTNLRLIFKNFIMKNKSFFNGSGLLLILLLCCNLLSAQTSTVGKIQNRLPVVTDIKLAETVLKTGLSATAKISNIHILQEPSTGKYYLVGEVSNDTITGKAIELQLLSGNLRSAGGPAIEITCNGYKCNRCIVKISKGSVWCVCEDQSPPTDMRCDMVSKVVLSVW